MKLLLLLIPCLISIWTPLYNSVDPTLAGIPMFYWFLMLMIPVSSVFIWLASKSEGSDA